MAQTGGWKVVWEEVLSGVFNPYFVIRYYSNISQKSMRFFRFIIW